MPARITPTLKRAAIPQAVLLGMAFPKVMIRQHPIEKALLKGDR